MTDAPNDPYGDRKFLEEQRAKKRQRGRTALEGAEEFVPARPEGEEAETPDEPDADKEQAERPVYRFRRIPRINGAGHVFWTVNGVPDDCPIVPLGAQGLTYWFLNPRGELVPMEAGKFGLTHIKGLAGDKIGWLERAWPKFNKQGSWTGFAAEAVQDALISAASAKGVFEMANKVRGRGCWKAEDGQLIQHLGNVVLVGDREHRPGEIFEAEDVSYVYPARPKIPAPKAGGKTDCETIYGHLKTWRWERGELDARLLLGWMGCVILGAALDWRPMVFWMGDAGTGKSTLQKLVRAILAGRLISTVDATPAALAQLLGADSLGVAFDELEADALTDQAVHVMKLARTAASGDNRLRGGHDHKAAEFQLRGCFAFSAIVPPSMRSQDAQRFAFLRLQRLQPGARAPELTAANLRELGAGLVGRITEGWSRWKPVLDAYRRGLERVGHAQRGQDQFGALLAAADILLHDEPPDTDTVDEWCVQLRREGLYEYSEVEDTWLKVWRMVLAAQPEAWRSDGFPTVAEVVQKYLRLARAQNPSPEDLERQQHKLNRAGLAIVIDKRGRPWLAIPGKHQAVAAMFAGSDFQARGGEGAWTNALRGAPRFEHADGVWKAQQVRQLPARPMCTLYRLDAVVELAGVRQPIFDDVDGAEDTTALDAGYAEREPGEEG